MINVLPPEVKTGYHYARRNVVLRKWVVLFLVALAVLGALATYGLLSLQQSTVHYQKEIARTEAAFQKDQFAATQKRVQDMTNNFKLVVKVLGQEVLFSQLLTQVAAIIPDNTNLTGLTISQTQGAIDISATAIDYRAATQLQVNLADPANKIFSKADILNVTCDSSPENTALYPCRVNLRALFAPNNPFLFINSKGAKP